MERKLTTDERRLVLLSVAEGIAKEESKTQLTERKAVLAKHFGQGINVSQANSVGAHLRIKAKATLKKLQVDTELLGHDQLIEYHHSYFSGISRRERRENISHLSEISGIPKPQLLVIVLTFDSLLEESLRKTKKKKTPKQAAPLNATTGDELLYAQLPSKQKMHAEWLQFLSQHGTREFFRNAKVLCTPSQFPDDEVRSIYEQVGIQRKNILAIERSRNDDVRKRFIDNCERLGIRYKLGELKDLAPTLSDAFAVVNYDPIGQFCTGYHHIFKNLHLDDRALIIANLRVGREDTWVQDALAGVQRGFESYGQFLKFSRAAEGKLSEGKKKSFQNELDHRFAEAANRQEDSSNSATLREVRERFIDHALINAFDGQREESYSNAAKYISRRFLKGRTLPAYCQALVEDIYFVDYEIFKFAHSLTFAAESLGQTEDSTVIMPHNGFASVTYDWMTGDPKASYIDKLEYRSDSKGRSKFYTTFAVMERPSELYDRWAPTAKFVLQAATCIFQDRESGRLGNYQLRLLGPPLDTLYGKPSSNLVTKQHQLGFFKDGTRITIAPIGSLLSSIQEYSDLLQTRFRPDSPWAQAEMERRIVS